MKKSNHCHTDSKMTKDTLKNAGLSLRKRNDISGVIAIRGSFDKRKIDQLADRLLEECGIAMIEKPHKVLEIGWIIKIDRHKKELIAINFINDLLRENAAEEVYKLKKPNKLSKIDTPEEYNIDPTPLPYSV